MNTWKVFKSVGIGLALVLLAIAFLPTSQASERDKKTIITVNETVEFSGTVLPPGIYVLKLLDSPSNRHIVQIFNEKEDKVFATILAIPNWRLEPTGDTVITFHEAPSGQPRPVRAWFYPGDSYGQEFAFPRERARTIAAFAKTPVPVVEGEGERMEARRAITPEGKEVEIETRTQQEQAPMRQAEQRTEVTRAETLETTPPTVSPTGVTDGGIPSEMPETAGSLPLVGLISLLSLGGALAFRALSKLF